MDGSPAATSPEVSAVPVAATPPPVEARKPGLEELRRLCTWQNGLSCAFALCAGAVAHSPSRVWRWLEHKRMEVETLGAAWEMAGTLVALVLAANALRVYAAMARRQINASASGGASGSDLGSSSITGPTTGQKVQAKKAKKANKRPKLEFIRK
jgi:hypothetical protein